MAQAISTSLSLFVPTAVLSKKCLFWTRSNHLSVDPSSKMKILILLATDLPIVLWHGKPSAAESNTTGGLLPVIDLFETETTELPTTTTSEVPTTKVDLNEEEFDRNKANKKSSELLSIYEKALKGYNREFPPSLYGPPLEIDVSLSIRGILAVSEVNMEIHLDLDVGFSWDGKRLTFQPPPNFREDIALHKDLSERIGTPSLSLLNEKESVDHTDVFNRDFLQWYPEGSMYRSLGIVSKLPRKMSLQNFPLDTQICSVNIGSHGNNDREYKISWDDGNYLDAEFINFVGDMSLIAYRGRHKVRDWGFANYTVLVQDLMLQRSVGYFVIGAYFPAALVVVISWLAFWMESAGERMALGVTCVLTITTLLLSAQASSPRVSYIKAIDVYMGSCFAMVFATLVHFTAAGVLMTKKLSNQSDKSQDEEQIGRDEDKQEPKGFFHPGIVALRYDFWS